MKKMTKKTLAHYRKMMDDLYDFMYDVIGNTTTIFVDITRWNATHDEYLAFKIGIEDPTTHDYDTEMSYHDMFYSNCEHNIEGRIETAKQFVLDHYKD